MSASTIISDVTQTLQDLLLEQQQPTGLFEVSLNSPADDARNPMEPKVNLFLLRVAENSFAKNRDWLPVGPGVLKKPPLALELYYIMTPFANDRLDEHRALGEAMRIFYDHAIIAAPLLKGELEHTAEELKVDLCPFSLEELTRIWNALNQPFRLSVCYGVRIILVDSSVEQSAHRVTVKENRYAQLTGR
jgi:Pvc16 N-terminal domain